MSWLTVLLRRAGAGGVLDAIEAAERSPSPATIAAAVTAGVTELPKLPDVAIETVGGMASDLVVETAQKLNPEAGALAGAVVPGLMQRLEAFLESELAALTHGLVPAPQKTMAPV